jgi:hypothetical protein
LPCLQRGLLKQISSEWDVEIRLASQKEPGGRRPWLKEETEKIS